jgi:dTDP-4-dehydrorhamnose reductase
MKILILDGQGKTGHVVSKFLIQNSIQVDSVSKEKIVESLNCNSNSPFSFLDDLVSDNHYDFVLNLIRVINEDAEKNKLEAIMINSYLPHFLEKITESMATRVIQLSTDCVFSGNNGPYSENSVKDGTSFYAITKSVGELNNKKDLTIRTSIIGPDYDRDGSRLFNWFMMNSGEMEGYSNVYWNGVTSIEFSKILVRILNTDIFGLIHIGSEKINKYELLTMFNKHFKNSKKLIKKNELVFNNKVLLCENTDERISISSYEQMMIEMKNWILANSEIYKHYLLEGEIK